MSRHVETYQDCMLRLPKAAKVPSALDPSSGCPASDAKKLKIGRSQVSRQPAMWHEENWMGDGTRWMQQQQQEQDQHHKCSTHLNPICWPANVQKSTNIISPGSAVFGKRTTWIKSHWNERERDRERERRERERHYTQYLYTVISCNII